MALVNIKKATKKILRKCYGIDFITTEILFDKGLLPERNCRIILIRLEYNMKVKPGEKEKLKQFLAKKYGVSTRYIEKIVQKQLP